MKKAIFTWANLVTLIRGLLLIPYFQILTTPHAASNTAFYLALTFILADKLDGMLARKLNQFSIAGNMFDGFIDAIFKFGSIWFLLGKSNLIMAAFILTPGIALILINIIYMVFRKEIFYRTKSLFNHAYVLGIYFYILVAAAKTQGNITEITFKIVTLIGVIFTISMWKYHKIIPLKELKK